MVTNDYGGALSANANLYLANVYAWGAGQTNTGISPTNGQSVVPANLTGVTAIAGGGYHSLGLLSNGRVVGWGNNNDFQTNSPATLTNASAIDAGLYHSLALRSNGTVTVWGYSGFSLTLVPLSASNVTAVAAGWYHNLALRSNGTVVAWGAGTVQGPLPNTGQSMVPTNLSGVSAIAAGGYHSLALLTNGTVVAWGWNAAGQTNVPAGLTNVIAIAAGGSNSLALKNDGTLVAWGDNSFGQTNIPVGLSNVVAISAGAAHDMALRNDGTLVEWGLNGNGQTNIPAGLSNIMAISAGGYHSMALLNVGPVAFLSQPLSQTIYKGSNVTFTAACLGIAPIIYQWLLNGTNVSNATNTSLNITAAQFTDAGNYQLVASNSFGMVTSAVAVLTVNDTAPFFTQQPANQSVLLRSNVTLSAGFGGLPPLAFQWNLEGMPVARATNASLTITNAQSTNAGNYTLVISNAFGTATSSNAFLTVIDLPTALNATNLAWTSSTNPPWFPETNATHDGFAAAATTLTSTGNSNWLRTTVVGPGTLSFWWQMTSTYGNTTLSFSDNGALFAILRSSVLWQQGTYYLSNGTHTLQWSLSGPYSPFYPATAWLDQVSYTPGPTPALILSLTPNLLVPAGTNVSMSVSSGGTPPLSFQWYFNGTNLPGKNSAVLSLSNVQAASAGLYSVTVSNQYGMTNATVSLTVNPSAPWFQTQPMTQKAVLGGNCIFSGAGLGSEPLSYQWQFAGNYIDGATNAQLLVTSVSSNDVGNYNLVVTNAYGSVVSSNAALVLAPSLLIAWGSDFFGQCDVPFSLSDVTAFAGGNEFSLAADSTGLITNWGFWNTTPYWTNPPGLVTAVAAGQAHMLALKTDQTVVIAGPSPTPVPPGLTNVIAIGAGSATSVALTQDGTVSAWGSGSSVTNVPAGLSNVVAIAHTWQHVVALKADGTVTAWGNGGFQQTNVPTGLADIVAVATGYYHSLALKNDGTVTAWGYNSSGQTNVPSSLSNVVAIAGGEWHSMALKRDGTVVVWGYGSDGETNIPLTVTNVFSIASGDFHCLALVKPPTLSIVRQPWSRAVFNGMKASFNVGVVGLEPIHYQWRFNGTDIPGANDATLTFTNAFAQNAGVYDVVITNSVGVAVSVPVTLSVQVFRPVVQAVGVGSDGNFGFDVSGPSGLVVIIAASTNLLDWTPVLTAPLVNGQLHFSDPLWQVLPKRFYRAQSAAASSPQP
jgi:alpha-tubulin suppressor-like RCC1 family protein